MIHSFATVCVVVGQQLAVETRGSSGYLQRVSLWFVLVSVLLVLFAMAHQVESSLQFQMEEAGVSAEVQKKIYAHGFTTLRTFAGLEESRAEVREVLKTDFGLDPAGNASLRKEVALLLSVWEAARSHLSFQEKKRVQERVSERISPSIGLCCHAGCCRSVAWALAGQGGPQQVFGCPQAGTCGRWSPRGRSA